MYDKYDSDSDFRALFADLTNDQLVELARAICIEARARGEQAYTAYTSTLLDEAEKARIEQDARAHALAEARAEEAERVRRDAEASARAAIKKAQGRAKISRVGDVISVTAPYDADFVARARCYGKWDGSAWVFPGKYALEVALLCHRYYDTPAPEGGLTVRYHVQGREFSESVHILGGRLLVHYGEGVLGAGVTLVRGSLSQRGSARKNSRLTTVPEEGYGSLLPVVFEVVSVTADGLAKRLAHTRETLDKGGQPLGYIRVVGGDVPPELADALAEEEARAQARQDAWEAEEAARHAKEKADAEEAVRLAKQKAAEKETARLAEEEAKRERQARLCALLGGVPVMLKTDADGAWLLVSRNDRGGLGAATVQVSKEGVRVTEPVYPHAPADAAAPGFRVLFDTHEWGQLTGGALVEIHRDALVAVRTGYFAPRPSSSFVADKDGDLSAYRSRKTLTPDQEKAAAETAAQTA